MWTITGGCLGACVRVLASGSAASDHASRLETTACAHASHYVIHMPFNHGAPTPQAVAAAPNAAPVSPSTKAVQRLRHRFLQLSQMSTRPILKQASARQGYYEHLFPPGFDVVAVEPFANNLTDVAERCAQQGRGSGVWGPESCRTSALLNGSCTPRCAHCPVLFGGCPAALPPPGTSLCHSWGDPGRMPARTPRSGPPFSGFLKKELQGCWR